MNPLDCLMRWRSDARNSEKLYGAIVAQARLPVFYRSFGVPDTLPGRSALLSLHLFAVLHRVKEEGPDGRTLAQELVDRFSRDMETVLRELGVSDLRIPKSMPHQATRLAAGLLGRLHRGPSLLCQCHRGNLAGETLNVELSSKILASYLTVCVRARAAAICEEARSIFQR